MYVARLMQVFLNDEPFTDRFMRYVRAATNADIHFGLVPAEEWDVPSSVNLTKAKEGWEKMAQENVLYARSKSYRQMCRYQSGFFMNHELLQNFDYAWRIEPGVSYFCNMQDEDPFRVMRDGKKKYGWAISLREEYVLRLTQPTHRAVALQDRAAYVARLTQNSAKNTPSTRGTRACCGSPCENLARDTTCAVRCATDPDFWTSM